MKKFVSITIVLSTLILMGCTQIRDQQIWTVVNNSSTDIYVEFTHDIYTETKIDTIKSGENMNVYYKEGVMQGENMESPTDLMTMLISNNQDSLVKDENIDNNWLVESEKIKKNGEERRYNFTFLVGDSDF